MNEISTMMDQVLRLLAATVLRYTLEASKSYKEELSPLACAPYNATYLSVTPTGCCTPLSSFARSGVFSELTRAVLYLCLAP